MKRLALLVSSALVVAAVALTAIHTRRSAAPAPAPASARWVAGEGRTYAIRWTQEQVSHLPASGASLTGSLELEADLSLTATQVSTAQTLVVLRLEVVRKLAATVMGRTLPEEVRPGAAAIVVLGPTGAPVSVRFGAEDPAAFRYLAQALAGELFPPLPGEGALTALERLPAGEVEATLAWRDAGRTTLERVRHRFTRSRLTPVVPLRQELESRAVFRFSPAGPLAEVDSAEQLAAFDDKGAALVRAKGALTVRLVGPSSGPAVAAADKPVVRPAGELTSEADVATALLESRAGDLTIEGIVKTLEGREDPAMFSQRDAFVWRAAGYLQLHPEACQRLTTLFQRLPSERTRGLLVDLLVSTGHAQAQAALRTIVTTPAASRDPGAFAGLFQRLGLLGSPERETVQLVMDQHARALREGDAAGRRVGAFTLGAMAARLAQTEGGLADLAGDILLEDLARAGSPRDRQLALVALGNAGDSRVLPAAKEALAAADPQLRGAAAASLRRVRTAEATGTLTAALAGDTSREGQAGILDALRGRRLGEGELGVARDLVVGGRLASGAERALLALLDQAPAASAAAIQALQALLLRPSLPPSLRVQAQATMERISAL